MKKILILLLVFLPFFLFSQVKLANYDASKIYPDGTRITYMQLTEFSVDADFVQFVEKEVLANNKGVKRFELAKDGTTCFYEAQKDITEEIMVDMINVAIRKFGKQ
ncbi:MAG: hypothetical protein PHE33_02090 [Bacteroidales bacterium]|nr:hypothetical protein [Bacteroidales bacterium]